MRFINLKFRWTEKETSKMFRQFKIRVITYFFINENQN